jgi:hypothetical protein
VVPFLRRRAARRASTSDLENASSSTTTAAERRARNLSEAGAPLLLGTKELHDNSDQSHDAYAPPHTHHQRTTPQQDLYDTSGVFHEANTEDTLESEPVSPTSTASTNHRGFYNPWRGWSGSVPPPLSSLSTAPRSNSSRPRAPLRHARTRIRATPIMTTVPENSLPPTSPSLPSPPLFSPTTPSDKEDNTGLQQNPSWLRIPSAPLISAFRRSLAASTSSRGTSATSASISSSAAPHPMSISGTIPSLPTASVFTSRPTSPADNYTVRSIPSLASFGHGPVESVTSGGGSTLPARLRPGGHSERTAQLVVTPFPSASASSPLSANTNANTNTNVESVDFLFAPDGRLPVSRAASLLNVPNGTGGTGGTGGRGSAYASSRSDLSVYTDARSTFDVSELGEREYRVDGSAGRRGSAIRGSGGGGTR